MLTAARGPAFRARVTVAVLCLAFLMAHLVGLLFAVRYNHDEILAAIRMTETSGMQDPPDGDEGLAIGPYQIHEPYWIDAGVAGEYQDCREAGYAERVIEAYMLRYVPRAWRECDAEVIARTHNGGPRGQDKAATLRYWRRVSYWLSRLPRRPAQVTAEPAR